MPAKTIPANGAVSAQTGWTGKTALKTTSRCAMATDLCRQSAPALEIKAPEHFAACHYAPKEALAA